MAQLLTQTQNVAKVQPFSLEFDRGSPQGGVSSTAFMGVNANSKLYYGLTLNGNNMSYDEIYIAGLGRPEPVPEEIQYTVPVPSFFCVLNININGRLSPYRSEESRQTAEITWVKGDTLEDLNPIIFEDDIDKVQIGARIVIGALVSDKNQSSVYNVNDSRGGINTVNSSYIVQNVNTHLMMCNMVFNGLPVLYPVPFGGGPISRYLYRD